MSGIEVVIGLATVISTVSSAINVGDKSHKIYKWYRKKKIEKEMNKWDFDDVEDNFTVIKKKE
tara:strand:+ start:429 stop:617 length:189 start_codon:yes stop_codon:yes gene_type:complete